MRRALALLALATAFTAGPVLADQLTGMGANIQGNYFSFPKANLDKTPVSQPPWRSCRSRR
jgi:hypothetical protein